jgi:capsular exopolysaccharide synthesis family protein
MSRILEAINKAAGRDAQSAGSKAIADAEDVLSRSYDVPGATARREEAPQPMGESSGGIDVTKCAEEMWSPNETVLFTSQKQDVPAREQFRHLRTKLYELREERPISVVAIVSAVSGEGKSFVATNLAHALALQTHNRVLLVDADLRSGALARLLGTRPEPGLAEVLRGEIPLEAAIRRHKNEYLYLLPSGLRVQEPGELIGGWNLRDELQRLRRTFDWIVIDTPPVIQFADSSVIAGLCDGVITVFAAGITPLHLAKRVLRVMNKYPIVGAVLNRAEKTAEDSKYYKYYSPA